MLVISNAIAEILQQFAAFSLFCFFVSLAHAAVVEGWFK